MSGIEEEGESNGRGKGRVRGGTDIQSNRTIDPALQDKHNESKHLARHSNKPYIYKSIIPV